GFPVPRQQLVQLALGDVGDARENIAEPGQWVDAVEPRGAEGAAHHRRALTAAVGPDEQPCLPAPGNTAQLPLGSVVRDADSPVAKERGEALPVVEEIGDSLGDGVVAREHAMLLAHPGFQIANDRGHAILPYAQTLG